MSTTSQTEPADTTQQELSTILQEQLVGSCLLRGGRGALTKLLEHGLTPEWFMDPKCQHTFDAIYAMYRRGDPIIELTTVWHELGALQCPFDSVWLDQCVDRVQSSQFARYYLETYRPMYHRRVIQDKLRDASDSARDGDIADIHKTLQNTVTTATELIADASMEQAWRARLAALIAEYELPPEHKTWIGWPIEELDRLIGRVDDELIYVASRPSVGKTAFAVQWLLRCARMGIRASLKTIESPTERILDRMIQNLGQVDIQDIRQGTATDSQKQAMRTAVQQLERMDHIIGISDTPANTAELSAWAQTEAAHGSKLLLIDNLKQIRPNPKIKNTWEQFAEYSRSIKYIRDDVQLPIVAFHHISRSGELAQSDDIERDGDIVIHLTLDEESSESMNPQKESVVNCEVRKNREGKAGIQLPILFRKTYATMEAYKAVIRERGLL